MLGDAAHSHVAAHPGRKRETDPRLERLHVQVFEELTFSVPHLVQFINATQNLRFDSAEIDFSNKRACVETYAHETDAYAFSIKVYCEHLDWQVSSATQISNALSQVLPSVEHLTFKYEGNSESSEEHVDVDRIELRDLLRSFSNPSHRRWAGRKTLWLSTIERRRKSS